MYRKYLTWIFGQHKDSALVGHSHVAFDRDCIIDMQEYDLELEHSEKKEKKHDAKAITTAPLPLTKDSLSSSVSSEETEMQFSISLRWIFACISKFIEEVTMPDCEPLMDSKEKDLLDLLENNKKPLLFEKTDVIIRDDLNFPSKNNLAFYRGCK